MDSRLIDFVEDVAQTIVGLDVALFFQANPRTFDTAAGLALRTHRDVGEVTEVLERMARHGILEAFSRGDGRYTCYALPKDVKVWNLLCLLSEAYLDHSESRKEIVRILIRRQHERSGQASAQDAGETT
ncbi:hypothetical protein LLH23_21245 [bacterium]|nr:hypothetical protein [bacterium]